MHFKLLVVFAEDSKTDAIMSAARESGATGCTVINNARGEGLDKQKSFLGLTLSGQRDVLLMLVEEHLSRQILEHICEVGEFDVKPGTARVPVGARDPGPSTGGHGAQDGAGAEIEIAANEDSAPEDPPGASGWRRWLAWLRVGNTGR